MKHIFVIGITMLLFGVAIVPSINATGETSKYYQNLDNREYPLGPLLDLFLKWLKGFVNNLFLLIVIFLIWLLGPS